MDLLFLGTCAGVPTKARNVSATAVIEASGSGWYLVDCGEGTQHQLLRTPLSIRDLRAIFITHVHGDHCFGLPGLLASAGMSGRTQPLELILPAALHDWVRQGLAASDTFLPFELRLLAVEELVEWHNDTVQVTTVQLSHRVPSVGFVFTEINPEPRLDIPRLEAEGIPRGPLWGELAKGLAVQHGEQLLNGNDYLRPSRPPRRVIVCGDNDTPELLADAAQGADVLVHEATFTQAVVERTGVTFGHSTAAAVARFAEAAGVRNLVLTHFSARYQSDPRRSPNIDNVRDEALVHYSGHLTLAQDLQRYHLGRDGCLELTG
ncbi:MULTISPECIES: MBL fold metallo-hydrolase [Pseudomonas]|uniref:Ribonuclease Z n=1 Tax=Pseudomonas putida TaxID=303 RepID=A0A1L7NG90_PSEPU|nr:MULTISPECIES: MBL fold metallo-hydrolase [Pseudomonas]PYG97318.1 MBL fold metallo-hydrolase [Arthrobacter stackebrandtii]MBP2082372.1 ribonuclease Z [Pseudomonas sp. PvP089]MBP2092009.1 ribonuclease Z [Pseudomonas sp. PvP088]MBP2221828.1 ribonuclease Z [Pseudomonas putida]PMY81487.1 MBL fold metallo-hydrolase [Pseudomonas sp. FW306-2-2C-D06B]